VTSVDGASQSTDQLTDNRDRLSRPDPTDGRDGLTKSSSSQSDESSTSVPRGRVQRDQESRVDWRRFAPAGRGPLKDRAALIRAAAVSAAQARAELDAAREKAAVDG